jgi:hypothetical protein
LLQEDAQSILSGKDPPGRGSYQKLISVGEDPFKIESCRGGFYQEIKGQEKVFPGEDPPWKGSFQVRILLGKDPSR